MANMQAPSSGQSAPLGEERPPRPTYAPVAAALGIMLFIWGFLTMWVMSVAGLGLFTWAMFAWIREIRLGWKSP